MYLDNAATTKIHPIVLDALNHAHENYYANYNAIYYPEALEVKTKVDECSTLIKSLLDLNNQELIYTSGATESNNYIIRGILDKHPNHHFITTTIEHKSVLQVFNHYVKKGFNITFISPNKQGVITSDMVKNVIEENTKFCSIMYVNNETGVINEVCAIAKLLRNKDILFHTDATQALGKVEIKASLFDYLSFSGHKIYGPKGIGLAIVNKEALPLPLLMGSNELRSGTLPTSLIIALTKAIELVTNDVVVNQKKLKALEILFLKSLSSSLGNNIEPLFKEHRVYGIMSIKIPNQVNNIFLKRNSEVIKASVGSACSITEPSYVLKEIGFTNDEIKTIIRISMSPYDSYPELNK